ncbi:MAG: CRTAC1 family protein [Planctomycetes bacterium]|nr:CRTAC1 family protein [Planctomycetota bacterium]
MDFIENVGRRSKVKGDTSSIVNVGIESLNGFEYNALYRNLGNGRFADYGYLTGCDRLEDGRGLAIADFDNDGDLDLAVANYLQEAKLIINHASPRNHWLELKLVGTRSNRDAVGARVLVRHGGRNQHREVSTAQGYLSGQSTLLHFGLGADAAAERVEIHWPSGHVQALANVAAGQRLRVVEEDSWEVKVSAAGGK